MNAPSGATKVAGIIGWPVEHSLSPAIQNAAFAAAGLDWVYAAFPVPPGEAARAVEAMRALGIRGLNVTMPHKHGVIPALDALTSDAERAAAVNTIAAQGDRLIGDNTDGRGFLSFLARDAGLNPAGIPALILGAGGAARAVAIALNDAGAEIVVAARRPEQAASVVDRAGGGRATGFDADVLSKEAAEARLVVNATPIGGDREPSPIDPAAFGERHIVVDLTYRPETTPLLRTARERGAASYNGLGMLIGQAALSFEAWTGLDAPVEVMRAAVGG